tara:strand:- start:11768 stop:11899 length:132 start_codon:yes stop_codon:yes gene_type:complete
MAKQNSTYEAKKKVSRPGVHAKTKSSKNKSSQNYRKAYRGQGR